MKSSRFLFVCGKNQLRSPTAEQVFSRYDGIKVLSAGTRRDAYVPLSGELIDWADAIFVMEKRHRKHIQTEFAEFLRDTKIVCLDIPDNYEFMDEKLVRLLTQRMQRYLSK